MKNFRHLIGIVVASLVLAVAMTVPSVRTAFAASIGIGTITHANMAPGGGGTTFTIASGCATTSALVGGSTSGKFATTATTCTPVITLPAAPTGWICFAHDITNAANFTQTASTTTSCTVSGTTTSGDTVQFAAFKY